jgi:hypothetical protein
MITRKPAGGFTLFETVLAVGLLVLLLSGVWQFYSTCLHVRHTGRERTQQALLARVILNEVAEEIRQAASVNFESGIKAIRGDRRSIQIYSATLPDREVYEIRSVRDGQLPGEHDIRRRQYFLLVDEDEEGPEGEPIVYGLVRWEEKTLNSIAIRASGDDEEALDVKLYAPTVKYLEFRYSDGTSDQWLKRWEGPLAEVIPQAVRITIGFVPDPKAHEDELADESDVFEEDEEELEIPHPDRYTMEVRLPTASSPLGTMFRRGTGSLAG